MISYFKAFNLFSASVPAEIEHEITRPDHQQESMMPVIRKKESSFLGMFEYRKDQEQQILRALIYGNLFEIIRKYFFIFKVSNFA